MAQCRWGRTYSAHSACSGPPRPGLGCPADAPSGCRGPAFGRINFAGSPLAKKKRDSSGHSTWVHRGPEQPCSSPGIPCFPTTHGSMLDPARGHQALELHPLLHTLMSSLMEVRGITQTPALNHPHLSPHRMRLLRKILTLCFSTSCSSLSV